MIEIVPARHEMADRIKVQEAQLLSGMQVTRDQLSGFLAQGPAFAAVIDDDVLAMAGLITLWPGRAVAWALLSDRLGSNMVQIHRAVLRGLTELFVVDRVEAYVAKTHIEGRRWCSLLGFRYEGDLRKFHNGQTYEMWARVKE